MRIAIDARAYSWAGIGRYTRNLLLHLVQIPTEHRFVVLLGKKDLDRFKAELGNYANKFEVRIIDGSYYSWQEQTVFFAAALQN